jgi:hypothetical protein
VIDLDAALGEEFFNIAVRESVAEVPADGQQDQVRREPETSERGRLEAATTNHPDTLRLAPDPSTQPCLLVSVHTGSAIEPVMSIQLAMRMTS